MKKARLNLELDGATKKRLDLLKTSTDATSITEVIRRALRLYEIVTDLQKNGGKLFMKKGKDEVEVIVL